MCNQCHDVKPVENDSATGRRDILKAGAALLAAPLMAGLGANAQAAAPQTPKAPGPGPYPVRAWARRAPPRPSRP